MVIDNPSYLPGNINNSTSQFATNNLVLLRIDFSRHPLEVGDRLDFYKPPLYSVHFKTLFVVEKVEGAPAVVDYGDTLNGPLTLNGFLGPPNFNNPGEYFNLANRRWVGIEDQKFTLTARNPVKNAIVVIKMAFIDCDARKLR